MDKVSEPRAITRQTPATHTKPTSTQYIHSLGLPSFDHIHAHHEYNFGNIRQKKAMSVFTVHALIHLSLELIEFHPSYCKLHSGIRQNRACNSTIHFQWHDIIWMLSPGLCQGTCIDELRELI